jgi:hypothetical protein
MVLPGTDGYEEDWMLDDVLDIEELCTADSVGEANRLLQEGWELLGFHPAPPSQGGTFGSPTTIFVMARLAEYEDDLDDADLELEEFEPLPS